VVDKERVKHPSYHCFIAFDLKRARN